MPKKKDFLISFKLEGPANHPDMSHKTPPGIDVTIPELVGVAAKRKSLGQFQGAFERQVTVLEADCRIADPNLDGTNSHCNEAMLDILEGSRIKLETAYTKWT